VSKKVLFYTHVLNLRGVTNAIIDYAEYNQTVLGNESTIVYNSHNKTKNPDMASDTNLALKLSKKYNIVSYDAGPNDDFNNLNEYAGMFDCFYFLKAGHPEKPEITSTKTVNHAVFQHNTPHGDKYAYVSEWLSVQCSGGKIPFVPHIVDQPPPNMDLRAKLGIPKNKFVFGRHGGLTTFDVKCARDAVANIASNRDDIVFLMVNTERFYEHPNIIYLPAFFGYQEKANYVAACDAMIHGRQLGESFGLAICDFLFQNKPVLAWDGGYDRNHILLLQKYGLLYDEKNIYHKMLSLREFSVGKDYRQIVEPFNPKNVMKKFKKVFLK
jgi:hypothetical protein